MDRPTGTNIRIKVVGVGGAGGNALARMDRSKSDLLESLVVNTDVQALNDIKSISTVPIGPRVTGGLGSGGSPEIGRKAIRESHDKISKLLDGADMVFVTAGMGGGTGTGAAPIIADIAKRQGALTVAVVTKPFSFEGIARTEIAKHGLERLEKHVDTLVTIENDRLLSSLGGDISLENAFQLADEVLREAVEGIYEIVAVPGLVNVDFADLRSVIKRGGKAFMAIGKGRGKSAVQDAIQNTLSNRLLDVPTSGVESILLNIRCGKDLTLNDVNNVAGLINKANNSKARVVFGVVQESRWKQRVEITLIATGISDSAQGVKLGHYKDTNSNPVKLGSTNGNLTATLPTMS